MLPYSTNMTSAQCEQQLNQAVPIGRPMENTQTYVLDEQMNPVPDNVIGQLYVGGPCVAAGYINQP